MPCSLSCISSDLLTNVLGWREEINRPGTLSGANWTYRLPWPSDQLAVEPEAVERAHTLRRWSERSGRAGHAGDHLEM